MTSHDTRFFQIFTYVLAALVGFTIFIYILASLVADNTQRDWTKADPARLAAMEARTAPLGRIAMKGGDAVTLEPNPSAQLTFLEEDAPAAGSHGGAESHGEGGDSHAEGAAMTAAAEEKGAPAEAAAEESMAAAEEATADEGADGETAEAADEAADTGAMTADAGASDIDGQAIYNQGCVACHAAGIAGAPKIGDPAAWEARVAQGNEVLYDHAINGYNAMPAKGGLAFLSDAEVKAAVDYMVGQL